MLGEKQKSVPPKNSDSVKNSYAVDGQVLNLSRSNSITAAHGVSNRHRDKPLKLRDPRMTKNLSILGGSIAEVDEINCEDENSGLTSAKDTYLKTTESAEGFVYLSESSSQVPPGSDDDEIDDLYYN